jgi:hypothetical protein
MLTYLLGDVLRLFAGDMVPGELGGRKASQGMWLGIAIIMLIPIVMVVLSLTLPYPAIGWVSIVVAVLVVGFKSLWLALPWPLRQLPDHRELRLQRVDRLVRMDLGLYGVLTGGSPPRSEPGARSGRARSRRDRTGHSPIPRPAPMAAAACELGISETTARQHLSGLYRRTGCLNAAQAAHWLGSRPLGRDLTR